MAGVKNMIFYNIQAETNVGKVRCKNEDNFYCDGFLKQDIMENNCTYHKKECVGDLLVLGVFDGMGGAHLGEKASYTGAELLRRYISICGQKKTSFHGKYVIQKINQSICNISDKTQKEIGSTVVLLELRDNKVRVFNVGDSRAYIFKNGCLKQLSIDHTEEQSMKELQKCMGKSFKVDSSKIKHTLTQHLGIREEEFLLEPADTGWILAEPKDVFLLCSDGLTNMVDDERIGQILEQNSSLQVKKNTLVQEALLAGGHDNITVVLLELTEE